MNVGERSVAAAPAPAAAAAAPAGHGRGNGAFTPQAEDGQLAGDVPAVAARARHLAGGPGDVLLEVLVTAAAVVLVDRHRSLTAPLHVALDELLGVLLEDVVDLVEQL